MTEKNFTAAPDTFAAVRKEIKALLASGNAPEEIVVTVTAGTYSPSDFEFGPEDCSGTTKVTYSAEKGAIIHGGVRIGADEWQMPDAEMASRFDPAALPHIRMISLASKGMTRAQWGEETAIGNFSSEAIYDDAPKGFGSEFFTGSAGSGSWEKRMIKARYPDHNEYKKLDAILDVGDCYEFPPQNYRTPVGGKRNLRGGCYIIDKETNERVKKWKDPSTAWMFGYFFHDWADASTPITVRPESREVYPKYVAHYGARAGALYYLYNVPEELDHEGEWYLDRETGNLYFWPWDGADFADFSCYDNHLIRCENVKNMEFRGFDVCCGIVGGILINGDDTILRDLHVMNIRENAVRVCGMRNLVTGCEIEHVGRRGVQLHGGDPHTFTHGENRIENCHIHHFAELYQTGAPAIDLYGSGNIAVHNELHDSPQMAIYFGGSDHLIEYNEIYDVVKMSNDAAAIYGGRDSSAYGTVIRYNRLKNIGSESFHPQAIYFDDALSGITAFGNIIINAGQYGFLVGGGRENRIENNLIVRSGDAALQYDDRLRQGYCFGGWYTHAPLHIGQINGCQKLGQPWTSRYPLFCRIITDASHDHDDPDFFCNPSYGCMKNNIAVRPGKLYEIADTVFRYSDISENFLYESEEAAGWDENEGNLRPDSTVYTDHPEFKAIPADEIGRK